MFHPDLVNGRTSFGMTVAFAYLCYQVGAGELLIILIYIATVVLLMSPLYLCYATPSKRCKLTRLVQWLTRVGLPRCPLRVATVTNAAVPSPAA
jgi:hypothetical protein